MSESIYASRKFGLGLSYTAEQNDLFHSLGRFRSGEDGVCQLITILLGEGVFAEAAGLPPILKYEREFALPHGRADFVLFHSDGTATVVEAKSRNRKQAGILAAIGQVMSYACQIGYGRSFKQVRKLVCADMTGVESEFIEEICSNAGVLWLPLGLMEEHSAPWISIFERGTDERTH